MCVCLAINALSNETQIPGTGGIPDLTKGGTLTRVNLRWAGPAGIFCGSWRPRGQKVEDVRQLQVLAIEKGSPADGILKIDDVILGADGTGADKVPLFEGASSSMSPIANAITEAEAHDPALLKLLIWRPVKEAPDDEERKPESVDLRSVQKMLKPYTEGETMTVTIKLETLGRYSDTAPYSCEKSRNILRKGIKALYDSNEPGKFYMGVLSLLAADDPTTPDNDKCQAKAKEWVHEMIAEERAWGAWEGGVKLIVLSEYYMKTKDETVFPILVKRAEHHARGVSWFGTTGHKFADKKPDGSDGGRISGYGPINGSGTQGFLALALARHAGVNSPVVDDAIRRQRIFFGHWAFRSGMGYGEMPYAIAGGSGDYNGKHALTAIALGLQNKQEEKAKYFIKLSALSTVGSRGYAHGGPFFGQVWQPVGAAQGGVKTAHIQFQEIRWHLDLKRSWDHSRIYDPTNNKYKGFSNSATALMFYALPLKQLYVTGRGQKRALTLSEAEFKELLTIKTFDAGKVNTQELIAELSRHQGMTRPAVAGELANRIKKDPGSKESAALVDQILALATDGKATISGRAGACTTLMFLKKNNAESSEENLKIVKTLISLLKDQDAYIRFGAVRAMQAFHPNFSQVAIKPYAGEIMDAIIATDRATFPLDEDDPARWAHGEMGAFLFSIVLSQSLEGVDRQKLVEAICSALRTPNGGGRYHASRILDKLTKEEVLAVADVLVDNTKLPPPANAMGGSAIIRAQAVLAKHLFEEALPLSFLYDGPTAIKNEVHQKYGQAAFEMQSTPELMEAFGDLMLAAAVFDANKVIEEMRKTPAPDGMAKLKRIDAVKAANSTLTLPATSTVLVVDATNDGRRGEDETTYTWRKVYGAGKVAFSPNASGNSKTTTVSFTDKKPGKYRFEVTMSDTLGYNVLREMVDVVLQGKNGKLPVNNPPKATSQSLVAVPGLPLTVTLAATDPDGDDLGFAVTQAPTHGWLSGIDGKLTYTPKFGYNGTDTLTFEAIDGQGKTAAGSVTFKVSDKNVGVAVYEGFDYPTGALHDQKGGSSFGFSGPWINSRGSADGYLVEGKTAGKNASLSYPAMPSTGGRFVKGQNHTACSRELDRKLLKKLAILEPGGEMWFSFFFSELKGRSVTFSAGEETSFGVLIREKNAGSGVHATIDREFDSDLDRNAWSRSASLRFSDGPDMVVGRCVWGKTDEDPDTLEVYRVFNAPGYDIVFPKKPVSVVKGAIPQEMIKAIVINQGSFESPLDEIRVGPTRHSVMVGTKPLTASAVK
jgi:hypothetical protein